MGTLVSGAVAISHMILGITLPNSYMALCGARALFEESYTDFSRVWLTLTSKDRSRIILNCLDLWGMAAMGEFFRFDGGVMSDVLPFEYFTATFLEFFQIFCASC